MAKHRSKWNEETFHRYICEGRGQGTLGEYKPWIRIQDFPSQGSVSRIKSMKVNRIVHLMSKNELHYFYLLEWSDKVVDIREQFPLLDVELSTMIADKIGVKHPIDNASGFPYVLTCDFMITTKTKTKTKTIARTIKQTKDLADRRTLEKLEIERRYWREKGVQWAIVTEHEINTVKAKNIEWLYFSTTTEDINLSQKQRDYLCLEIKELYDNTELSVLKIIEKIESGNHLQSGVVLRLFKYMARTRQILIPMEESLNLSNMQGRN